MSYNDTGGIGGEFGMNNSEYWAELSNRVEYIRAQYKNLKIKVNPNEGLGAALEEVEKLVREDQEPIDDPAIAEEGGKKATQCLHVIWALFDVLKQCVDAGLDVKSHLKQINTGTINFGIPE